MRWYYLVCICPAQSMFSRSEYTSPYRPLSARFAAIFAAELVRGFGRARSGRCREIGENAILHLQLSALLAGAEREDVELVGEHPFDGFEEAGFVDAHLVRFG
jgi:hypothetical protein